MICVLLLSYQRSHGLHTVRTMIDRWAPPSENDTGAYVDVVAKAVGVSADAPINVSAPDTMEAMVAAIVRQENGQQPYDHVTIALAMNRAGVIG